MKSLHSFLEDGMTGGANRQADLRSRLDEIDNRLAQLVRAGATPARVEQDPGLKRAAKGAAAALPEIEGASKGMGESADALRQGAPGGDRSACAAVQKKQLSVIEKLEKARLLLGGAAKGASDEKKRVLPLPAPSRARPRKTRRTLKRA